MKNLAIWLLCSTVPIMISAQNLRVTSTSMAGIGIHTSLADLKTRGVPVPAVMDTSEFGFPAFKTNVQGADLRIEIIEEYQESTKTYIPKVFSLYTEDAAAATPSGVRIGSNKFDVIKRLDGMYLEVRPDYRKQEANLPDAEKRRYSAVVLTDGENGTMLTMYFRDNTLYAFMVSVYEGC